MVALVASLGCGETMAASGNELLEWCKNVENPAVENLAKTGFCFGTMQTVLELMVGLDNYLPSRVEALRATKDNNRASCEDYRQVHAGESRITPQGRRYPHLNGDAARIPLQEVTTVSSAVGAIILANPFFPPIFLTTCTSVLDSHLEFPENQPRCQTPLALGTAISECP
ncbi:hypothetical protein [Pseudomonas sp. S2_F03]